MSRFLLVAGLVVLVAPGTRAQTVRWNDTPTAAWSEDAPRVRLSIDGPRGVSYGGPVLVRFEVSDNAYVVVARVDGDGRMTILFPYSRNQRATARGGLTHWVRHPRLGGGQASFYANDRFSGFVFAIASYAPFDLSRFENRDYDRIGGMSRFTLANRTYSFRPDVYVDRFAASVLWDVDTPFDYDVDYYHTGARPGIMNAYSMCGAMFNRFTFSGLSHRSDWADWDLMPYPYSSMCRDWYGGIRCFSMLALYSYTGCNIQLLASGPTVPGGGPVTEEPADDDKTPNEGVVKGGLTPPTPAPIPVGGQDNPPVERRPNRFDQLGENEWDRIKSIPARATRRLKEEDERRDRGGTAAGSSSFDRSANAKSDKATLAANSDRVRTPPPSREPTRAKVTDEPRHDPPSRNRPFGTSGVGDGVGLQPGGIDRVSRPTEAAKPATTPAASGGSFQGTTTEKKKPPTD